MKKALIKTDKFENFREFYNFYLTEHSHPVSRLLHFIGTGLVIFITFYGIFTDQFKLLWFIPLVGYGFAWVGHFFFEKNKPATFKHPFYSLGSDFVMFFDIVRGKVKL